MSILKFFEKKIIKHLPALARTVQRSLSDEKKIEAVYSEMRSKNEIIDMIFPYREKFTIHRSIPEKSTS